MEPCQHVTDITRNARSPRGHQGAAARVEPLIQLEVSDGISSLNTDIAYEGLVRSTHPLTTNTECTLERGRNAHADTKTTPPRKSVKKGTRFLLTVMVFAVVVVVVVVIVVVVAVLVVVVVAI